MNHLAFYTIDNGTYEKYLSRCYLPNLTVIKASDTPLAIVYNRIIDRSENDLIAYIHSDVTCKGLPEAIVKTMMAFGNWGALGAVGATKGKDGENGIQWGRKGMSYPVVTLDSCLLVIDRRQGVRFNAEVFDSFHCVIEEYCMQIQQKGLDVRTILIDGYEGVATHIGDNDFFSHHSNTVRILGGDWGNYSEYYRKLKNMYPSAITTSLGRKDKK
jgi:hypothetical protein